MYGFGWNEDKPAATAQGRYRVGDRVRVVDASSHVNGKAGEITSLYERSAGVLLDGSDNWLMGYSVLAPAFRPGDRVRLNKHSGVRACGERGTVTAVIGDNVSVRMDDASAYGTVVAFFHADNLDWERVEERAADCAVRKEQQGNVETLTIKLDLDTSGFSEKLDAALGANHPCIVALVKDGKPRPSQWPFVHPSVAEATTEAERLARNNPGQEFAVYQRVAGRVAEVSYEMKEVA
jgi:hypothetical protein